MADSPAAPASPSVAEKTPSSPNVVADMFSALGKFSNNVTKSAAATADTLTKGAVATKDDVFSALGNFSNNVTKSAANTSDAFAKGAVATTPWLDSLTKSVAAVAEATVSTAAAAAEVVTLTDRDKAVPVSDDEVNAPTPVERWFMVAEGWTCDPVHRAGESKARPPPPLMPHDYTALTSIEALGMLELEVLEAKDLPSKLLSGGTDAYALLLLEGVAARSSTIHSSISPRWPAASSYRAFRLPVSHACAMDYRSNPDAPRSCAPPLDLILIFPSWLLRLMPRDLRTSAGACLYLSIINDSDADHEANLLDHTASAVSGVGGDLLGRTVSAVGGVGGANVKAVVDGGTSLIKTTTAKARDMGAEVSSAFRDEVGRDSVGRVTLPLSALVSGVQYDAWFALAFNRHTDQPGQHGFVRLRYTLRVTSSRTRMLSYASAPPPHLLPFTKEYYRHLSLFATADVCRATKGYDYQILTARLNELRRHWGRVVTTIAAVEHVLLWRPGVRWSSLGLFVGWQLVLTYPRYLPAALCCLGLQGLNATYSYRAAAAHRQPIWKPSFWRMLASFARPGLAEISLTEIAAAEPADAEEAALRAAAEVEATRWLGALSRRAEAADRVGGTETAAAEAEEDAHTAPSSLDTAAPAMGGLPGGHASFFTAAATAAATTAAAATETAAATVVAASESATATVVAATAAAKTAATKTAAAATEAIATAKAKLSGQRNVLVAAPVISCEYELGVRFWQRWLNPPIPILDEKGTIEREATLLEAQKLAIRKRVERHVFADETVGERLDKALHARERERSVNVGSLVNPLAPLLGKVQVRLLNVLHPLRGFVNLVTWQDCRLTTWLYIGLSLVTLASVFIPWPALVQYGLRAAGLLACGPHMLLVGRWVDVGRRAERTAERSYRQADANGRAAILADYEKQLIDEARVRLVRARAANARRPPRALAQSQFLEAHPELRPLRLQEWRTGAHLSEDTLAEPVRFTARVAPPPVAPGGGTPPAGGRGSDGRGHVKTD